MAVNRGKFTFAAPVSRTTDRGRVKRIKASVGITTDDERPDHDFYNRVNFIDEGETQRGGGIEIEYMFLSIGNKQAVEAAIFILKNLAPEKLAKE